MKYLGVLAFVGLSATILAVVHADSVTYGTAGPRDILLHREVVSLDWKMLRVVTRDVEFYPLTTNRTITAIRAIDVANNGAKAILKRGGPGFRNATIHLKSERNRGLNFIVEIVGL